MLCNYAAEQFYDLHENCYNRYKKIYTIWNNILFILNFSCRCHHYTYIHFYKLFHCITSQIEWLKARLLILLTTDRILWRANPSLSWPIILAYMVINGINVSSSTQKSEIVRAPLAWNLNLCPVYSNRLQQNWKTRISAYPLSANHSTEN